MSNITDPDRVRCHIPSSCDRISCCVYIPEVQRHAKLELNMDTCNYQMEGAIDNLRYTYGLFDYTFGKPLWIINLHYLTILCTKIDWHFFLW